MYLGRIQPKPQLAEYIDALWIFEANFGLPSEDSRVIAPNGKAKLIYSYRNTLSTLDNGKITHYPENDIFFIGIWNRPVTLVSNAAITGTIGIELTPNGLHRFLKISALELMNQIFSFSEIYGVTGKMLVQRLGDTPHVLEKVDLLQDFLIRILNANARHNAIVDYSVNIIRSTQGLLTIRELEKKMGYSKRYLDMLFREHVGISPKALAGIARFQNFYHLWASSDRTEFHSSEISDIYYDQAHFIKEFRRYTGFTPGKYLRLKNDFGKLFYKPH